MNAKLLNVAAGLLFGAAVISSSFAAQADDADINNANSPVFTQLSDNAWSPKDYPEYRNETGDAESQGYFFMANPETPFDWADGGDE
jgi:hypothetical protein